MRQLMLTLHKYAGLALGLIFAVVGISGSLLVFDHAIDETLTPAIVTAGNSQNPAPLSAVLAAAEGAVDGDLRAYRIYLARQPGSPHVVRFEPPDGTQGPIEVSVAPASADVLAVRTWGEYPVSWLYSLHFTLLAGTPGKMIVGLLGILLLFFCISGVVIWWPRKGRWRRALMIRRDRGTYLFNLDLHKATGIYLLPVLATVAFSGVAIVFPGAVTSMVDMVLPVEERAAPGPLSSGSMMPVDAVVAAGQRVFPAAVLKRVHLPGNAAESYLLYFNTPAEPWANLGASAVWVDPYSGDVLDVLDYATEAAGNRFMRWQFPLHNGDALGLPGRWLVFLAGWLPALLFGTGVYMWWRKRRNGRHLPER